jgi:hypothetical protein
MMRKVTIDQVMAWDPCEKYTRERVAELFGEREYLTAWDIIAFCYFPSFLSDEFMLPFRHDKCINIDHIVWALLHEEFFSNSDLRMMAGAFAERVLVIYERRNPGDNIPRNAIRVARLFAMGEVDAVELVAAWGSSLFISLSTCAESNVSNAATSAAGANAGYSARCAALYASWVTRDGERGAEDRAQLEIIKLYLENQEEGND